MIQKYRVVKDHLELLTDYHTLVIREKKGVTEEQLVLENVLEFLKKELARNKEQQNSFEIQQEFSNRLVSYFSAASAFAGAMGIGIGAWFNLLHVEPMLGLSCGMTPFALAFGFTFKEGYRSHHSSKRLKQLSYQREFLEKSWEEENGILEILREKEQSMVLEESDFIDLDDREKINSYQRYLSCYEKYLMQNKQYQDAYQNGKLDLLLASEKEDTLTYELMYKMVMMDATSPEQARKTYQLIYPQKRS